MPSERYRVLDLNLIVVFDALLKHRNVSRAAEELCRSQSAISHALARLRKHFGDDLFVKVQDGIVPTTRALELEPAVARFTRHADEVLVRPTAFAPLESNRTITMALSDGGELATAPALIEALRAEAPGCRLQMLALSAIDVQQDLEDGRIDLAISGPLHLVANIVQQKLYDHAYVAIVASDSPVASTIDADMFQSMRQVVVVPAGSYLNSTSDFLSHQGIKLDPVFLTQHALMLPHVVRLKPDHVAIVPKRMADIYAGPFELRVVDTRFPMPSLEVFQYFHRRVRGDPFHMWLRTLVSRTFRQATDLHVRPSDGQHGPSQPVRPDVQVKER